MNSFNKPSSFLSHTSKLSSARPNTDCLAASKGVCTKRNMARFELLLFENEVNNNSQTWPLIHLTSLATFYFKTLLLKWVMPVKEYYEYEMNMKWIWIWTKWQISVLGDIHIMLPFTLILIRRPKIIVKKNLRVILSSRMLFKVAFRCMFY